MSKDIKVSRIQLRGLIVSTVVGIGILSLPHDLAVSMDNKGWIAILISGLLTLPVLALITQIFKQNPNKDFFEIGDEVLGKVVFTICKILFIAYLLVYTAIVARSLGELIKAFLLPTTPTEIIILVFIITTSYTASHEINVIARTGYFMYPIILFFVLLIVLISLPYSNFSNLLPLTNIDLARIPQGIKSSFFSFAGFEMVVFALPFVEDKDKVFQSCVYGIGIVTLIYLAMFIMSLSQFSIEQIQRQSFPVLQLVKQIDLPGYFLENLDGIVMAIWVLIIATTMIPAYFGAGKVLSKIFNTKKHKYFIWALIPVIYFISVIPDNFIEIDYIMLPLFDILALISMVIIPVLLLTVGSIRKKVDK